MFFRKIRAAGVETASAVEFIGFRGSGTSIAAFDEAVSSMSGNRMAHASAAEEPEQHISRDYDVRRDGRDISRNRGTYFEMFATLHFGEVHMRHASGTFMFEIRLCNLLDNHCLAPFKSRYRVAGCGPCGCFLMS